MNRRQTGIGAGHGDEAVERTKGKSGPGRTERRRSPHRRVLYRAWVVFDDTTLTCTVRDISEHGCRLKFAVAPVLPQTFDLVLHKTGERRRCRLVWISEREAGVSFIDEDE